mmetsp:Transcript_101870/g.292294  ORF Transcript_101870/g.292294 Transcript_101870/m.292294 type:complete len:341 (+) Transcript_101870:312-1334(+)
MRPRLVLQRPRRRRRRRGRRGAAHGGHQLGQQAFTSRDVAGAEGRHHALQLRQLGGDALLLLPELCLEVLLLGLQGAQAFQERPLLLFIHNLISILILLLLLLLALILVVPLRLILACACTGGLRRPRRLGSTPACIGLRRIQHALPLRETSALCLGLELVDLALLGVHHTLLGGVGHLPLLQHRQGPLQALLVRQELLCLSGVQRIQEPGLLLLLLDQPLQRRHRAELRTLPGAAVVDFVVVLLLVDLLHDGGGTRRPASPNCTRCKRSLALEHRAPPELGQLHALEAQLDEHRARLAPGSQLHGGALHGDVAHGTKLDLSLATEVHLSAIREADLPQN